MSGCNDSNNLPEIPAEYLRALWQVVKEKNASLSFIQRRCGVGYVHAGKIVDWMEACGYVEPFDGTSKPRKVLLTEEDFENLFGSIDELPKPEAATPEPAPRKQPEVSTEVDPLYIQALKIAVKLGQISMSTLQRQCCIGYNHAGKIMDWMEGMGYVSAFSKNEYGRKVLLTKEEFEQKYGSLD